jgi:ketosteroid isomerase-like protein
MAGYWKSDQTAFVGASGMTRGWQSVLEHYQKIYPNRQAMGQLTFSALEIHLVCSDAAFAIGQFQLERQTDQPAGIFTLNFRKFPEGWRIVADHTTAFASPSASTSH